MALHNFQYGSARGNVRKGSIYEIEAWNMLGAQVEQLSKKLDRMGMNAVTSSSSALCEICGDGHHSSQCTYIVYDAVGEQVNMVGGGHFNQKPIENSFSNTYNTGWRNYPDFSWSNSQSTQNPPQLPPQNFRPPGFQQHRNFNTHNFNTQVFQNQGQPSQSHQSRMEMLLETFIMQQKKKEEVMEQQVQQLNAGMEQLRAHNKMLENQIAQQAASSSQRNLGRLPSQPEAIPRGEVRAIMLQSGRQLEPPVKEAEQESEKKESANPNGAQNEATGDKEKQAEKPYVPPQPIQPPLPFPQRVQKEKREKQFSKFMATLQKLSINVPFIEALAQMPSYAKSLKKLLSNKSKLEDYVPDQCFFNNLEDENNEVASYMKILKERPIANDHQITVVQDKNNELTPTRMVNVWRICSDYRKYIFLRKVG